MTRRKVRMAWFVVVALFLLGTGACERPKLDDSMEPLERYLRRMVSDGDSGVPLNGPIGYYVGQVLDPGGINDGTVQLRTLAGGTEVRGEVSGFDLMGCMVGGTAADCPRGVAFSAGGGAPCDLDPETQYELVLNGLRLADGSTLPRTVVTFRTGPVPPGYTPRFCSQTAFFLLEITGDTLDPASGISGDLAAETVHHLDIVAVGVENQPPFYGYQDLVSRYFLVLELMNFSASSDFDLSATVGWVNVRTIDGVDTKVYLPPAVIPSGQTLVLYVADDGSSYYAIDPDLAGATTYDIGSFGDYCDSEGSGCPVYLPVEAFSHLAAPADASPSVSPFIVEGDSLDAAFGINGGMVTGNTADLVFRAMGVQARPPYTGYDQLNNINDFGFGSIQFGDYLIWQNPGYLREKSPYVVGHYEFRRHGATFEPPRLPPLINTTNSWLLLYIYNKDSTLYSLAGNRTITIRDDGSDLIVRLPGDTIPPGEALPLYVADNGATFYAFTEGMAHTLNPLERLCDGSAACPLVDPVSALLNPPAMP